ncbi:MAG: undecaprenyl-diphosphate phosphatase [Clostridia bacterium]|nr:undecaprenyl-diphosphate phosphatase [Clostridia bacterium]
MDFIEILKAIFIGIVEGITEWLPISSTGHMILVDEFIKLNISEEFKEFFLVVIQLGAILAVVVLYFKKLFPFELKKIDGKKKLVSIKDTWILWAKVLVACVPAGIIGLLFDDLLDKYLYNPITVALMLILYGILFIIVEKRNKGKESKINTLKDITFKTALIIGVFQVLALIPGTSRSGATILGAILIGTSREIAAEFTFFLAIPVMVGASLYKLLKFIVKGVLMTSTEFGILVFGTITAFIVSMVAIKFLMKYIKKNDFTAFGWYRIVLGVLVLLFFFI